MDAVGFRGMEGFERDGNTLFVGLGFSFFLSFFQRLSAGCAQDIERSAALYDTSLHCDGTSGVDMLNQFGWH